MSFESFLEKTYFSEASFSEGFILHLIDFHRELKEDEYRILLEFIKKNCVPSIHFNPDQENDFSKSVFKETINEELIKNKLYEDYLKAVLPTYRPERSDYENYDDYIDAEYDREMTIDLREYPEKLTENRFKRLYEHLTLNNENRIIKYLFLTKEQEILLNKSEFKHKINFMINSNDNVRGYGEPRNYNFGIHEPFVPFEKQRVYIPRKGWIELKMKENNEVGEECEYNFSENKIAEFRKQSPKFFIFNMNYKPDNNKRIQNQAKKLIIDSELSSIWDESLINDYYALKELTSKEFKQINFKE